MSSRSSLIYAVLCATGAAVVVTQTVASAANMRRRRGPVAMLVSQPSGDHAERARYLVEQLRQLPTPMRTGLRAVRDPEEIVRSHVFEELRSLDGGSAAHALAGALRDSDVSMRRNALLALMFLGSGIAPSGRVPKIDIRATLPLLMNLVVGDADDLVRAWAAQAIGAIKPAPAPAVAPLIAALSDRDIGVRLSACAAIAAMAAVAEEAAPALAKMASDLNEDVRRCGKHALGRVSP